MSDDIGDRMKAYEAAETGRAFDRSLPLVVRLDGRAFSTFTRGMVKPFDANMMAVMDAVTASLVAQTHPVIAYTQSDEITLIYEASNPESELIFGGRAFKIASVLAGLASSQFTLLAWKHWPAKFTKAAPAFDCRAFSVPSRTEAVNALIWRELDASRNAILAIGQSRFSPKQMHGRSCGEVLAMLGEIGVSEDQYPLRARFGVYLGRRTFETVLTPGELERIPAQHRPAGPVMRSRVIDLGLAPLIKRANREAMIFQVPLPSTATHEGENK